MFEKRLKELRLNMQTSNNRQEDVAKLLGIARTTYAMYEQGQREPDNSTLEKIADLFDVSIDYLLGRTDTPIQQNTKGTIIDTELSPENIEELKKYAELLKFKEMAEKNKLKSKNNPSASGTDKR